MPKWETRAVIVCLDTNALLADPLCRGMVWRVLAHAPQDWSLRVTTSEVAVAEAVAGYQRQLLAVAAKLEAQRNDAARLGAAQDLDDLQVALTQRLDRYGVDLGEVMQAAGIEVVRAPDVDHMTLVHRAVGRRRPCDEKGDGYRDTLHWFSVLEMAAQYPDERLVLVTTDPDFLNDDRSGFHSDLVEDLTERDLQERVFHAAALADVVLKVAERTPGSKKALRELRSELQDETVRQFVEVIAASAARSLDLRRCALPPATIRAVALQVGPLHDLEYNVKGQSAETEAVAEFSCEADTSILVTVPAGVDVPGAEQRAVLDEVAAEASYVLTKPLVFSGILQLGRYDRPLGGEVSRIAARPDDPGRLQWAALDRLASSHASTRAISDLMKQLDWYTTLNINPLADAMRQADLFKNINPLADAMRQADLFKNINPLADAMRQADLFKNINPLADAMRQADLFKNINPLADAMRQADLFKNINPLADVMKQFDWLKNVGGVAGQRANPPHPSDSVEDAPPHTDNGEPDAEARQEEPSDGGSEVQDPEA